LKKPAKKSKQAALEDEDIGYGSDHNRVFGPPRIYTTRAVSSQKAAAASALPPTAAIAVIAPQAEFYAPILAAMVLSSPVLQ
ncbi:hypothetical protein H0H92_011687, partial [Tricholoma furcatifolium]